MSNPLLVVDVQNGFINEFTHHVSGRIINLIESGGYQPVLFTQFINNPESPFQRLMDWHDCETEPETTLIDDMQPYINEENVFVKQGHSGVSDELSQFLMQQEFSEITLVGIDTDMCVLKTALDIFDLGIRPIVLADCCASTSGLQSHLAGLAILARNIGADQLREAGLNEEGGLGAPAED